MANIFDLYETNLEKENNGVPVALGEATVYVASSNATGNKRLAAKQAEFSKIIKGKKEEDNIEYLKELYAECVLVNWKNVKDKNGKEIPYSKENAKMLFDKLPHFFDKILEIATNLSNFQDEKIEEAAKN